ncbi:MAG: hypothetical protein MUP76_06950 [Acidimicrobiia bacterium]|nr:hypothetical protein [Acidimicrobiia bacterium]
MDHMIADFASLLAAVRPTEVWTASSIVAGILLLGAVVAAMVAWAVHVATRR